MSDTHHEFTRGWKPLVGAMALYAASPVIIAQTASVFIEPIMTQTGLPQTAISIGPVIFITLALSQPVVAVLINKFGTRVLGLIAVAVMFAGTILLGIVPPSPVSFLGIGVLMGVGGALGYLATTAQFLSKWFTKNYALTVGVVGAIGGIVPLILTPILGVALEAWGWQSGYLLIATFILVICVPLVVTLFREPRTIARPLNTGRTFAQHATRSGQDLEGLPARQAAKSPVYWLYTISFLGVSIAVGGLLASIVPILISKGLEPTVAATVSVGMLAGVMAGRLVGGLLLDRSPSPYMVPVALFAISAAATLATTFADENTAPVVIFLTIFLIGVSQGAEGDFPAYFFRREFGRRALATLTSWVYLGTTGFAGIGGLVFAAIRDATGGYSAAMFVAVAGFALGTILSAIVLALAASKRKQRAPHTPTRHTDAQPEHLKERA